MASPQTTKPAQQFALSQTSQKKIHVIPGILDEKAINKLEIFKISTSLKFIQADTRFLANLLKVSEGDIDRIKNQVLKNNCPRLICADEIYEDNRDFYVLSTGISGLDEILDGGIQNDGYILEICGISAIGKSFLCTTIAINLALNYDFEIIFIDTKRDATGRKFFNILEAKEIQTKFIESTMKKIKIERVFNLFQLIQTLKYVIEYAEKTKNFKLLIIDSIPSLLYLYNDDVKTREILLSEIISLIQKLANEYKIIVIIINIIIRWIEDDDMQSSNLSSILNSTTILNTNEKPGLGQSWYTVPSTRIQMDFIIKNGENFELSSKSNHIFSNSKIMNKRSLKIVKSNSLQTGNYTIVDISNSGFI